MNEKQAKIFVLCVIFCLAIAVGVGLSAACYQLLNDEALKGHPALILEP